MRHLLEADLTKNILDVTVWILKENFSYDYDTSMSFCNAFVKSLNEAHTDLMINGPQDFKAQVWGDPDAMIFFTLSFTGYHITKILKEEMDFNFQELNLFTNLISKYIKIEEVEI